MAHVLSYKEITGRNLSVVEEKFLAWRDKEEKRIIVDFSKITYIDAVGRGALLNLFDNFEKKGKTLIFLGVQKKVNQKFLELGLSDIFVMVANENELESVLEERKKRFQDRKIQQEKDAKEEEIKNIKAQTVKEETEKIKRQEIQEIQELGALIKISSERLEFLLRKHLS